VRPFGQETAPFEQVAAGQKSPPPTDETLLRQELTDVRDELPTGDVGDVGLLGVEADVRLDENEMSEDVLERLTEPVAPVAPPVAAEPLGPPPLAPEGPPPLAPAGPPPLAPAGPPPLAPEGPPLPLPCGPPLPLPEGPPLPLPWGPPLPLPWGPPPPPPPCVAPGREEPWFGVLPLPQAC
jgi:hypothetical protein